MEKSLVVNSLVAVRELLSDPARHCKSFYAMDAEGNRVFSNSPDAVKWCLIGACTKIADTRQGLYEELRTSLKAVLPGPDVNLTVFNDYHSHEEVLQTIDKAIELANAA